MKNTQQINHLISQECALADAWQAFLPKPLKSCHCGMTICPQCTRCHSIHCEDSILMGIECSEALRACSSGKMPVKCGRCRTWRAPSKVEDGVCDVCWEEVQRAVE